MSSKMCRMLPVLFLLLRTGLNAQTTGKVSGIADDATGKPAVGVPLMLSGDDDSSAAAHATTDMQGKYEFGGLSFGRYHLSSDQAGTSIAPAQGFTLSAEHPELRLTLTVTTTSTSAAASNLPPDSTSASHNLNLQAAGIRGYIDPGGYSAPAGAAAATDLVRGVADIKREDNTAAAAGSISCIQHTGLLKTLASNPDDARANLELGQDYLMHHQATRALPYLKRAWSIDPSDPNTRASLAEAFLQNGQFLAARDLLTQTPAGPETAETHRMLARADEGLGFFLEASKQYQAAIELQPTEENYFGAGYELILAGSPKAGDQILKAGAAKFPDSTIMLMGIGTIAFLESHNAEATQIFLRAISLNALDPRPYEFLSVSSGLSGVETESVQASFRRFYELLPDNAEAAYLYAVSMSHQAAGSGPVDSTQIESLLRRSIELDPHVAKAHVQLGSMLFDQQQYTQAANEFETALQLNPDLWDIHRRLSAAYRRTDRPEQAEKEMQIFLAHRNQKAAEGEPSDINIEQFLSVFNQTRGEIDQQPACGDNSLN